MGATHRNSSREKVPCIVFSTGNELVTPGPSAYDIKLGDIADKLERGCGVTFKGKNVINNRSPELSPGPADYSPDITRGGSKKNAFSIGRAPKDVGLLEKIQRSPGPGAYEGDKIHRINSYFPSDFLLSKFKNKGDCHLRQYQEIQLDR